MTTATETTGELIQNHEHRRCAACGKKIGKSQMARRYSTGEVRHPSCPAPEPVVAAPVVAAAPADSRRRNRYPGTCECGRHVPAGGGFLENDGEWHVFCGSCGLSSTVG
jgi:hypothetical protein